jgi:ribulose-5-phosphate 4-epimerase/fuculose-1-phosphate aldolase
VAGEGLPGDVLPEIVFLMGEVPCVPYATTGTPALGNAAEPYRERQVALLLANHGGARAGRVSRLTREQIDALERMRGMSSHGQIDPGY